MWLLQRTFVYVCASLTLHLRIDYELSQTVYMITLKQICVCTLLRDKPMYRSVIIESYFPYNYNAHSTNLIVTHSCQSISTTTDLSLLMIIIKDQASIFIILYYSFRSIRFEPPPCNLVHTCFRSNHSSITHNTLTLDLHLLI